MKHYKLNGNITVLPARNMVNDVKLEPRLMKLLCLLLEKRGQTVTRDEIINDIWKGYGGGDDGLTQAVSFLRKVLNDTDKTLIETVPKTGYIFNGEVTTDELIIPYADSNAANHTTPRYKYIFIAIVITVAVLALIVLVNNKPDNAPPAPNTTPKETPAPAPIAP